MFARPKRAPFAASLLTHGLILGWVASGRPAPEETQTLYKQVIAPHASKIIWYNFRDKLPQVSPAEPLPASKPPRADVKIATQEIVAGSPKSPRARQFVWLPAPKIELRQDLESPNLVAVHAPQVAPPPKPKLFTPPPASPRPAAENPGLAAPPQLRASAVPGRAPVNYTAAPPLRPQPKSFVPPEPPKLALPPPAPALPAPPSVATGGNLKNAKAPPGGKPSPFGPPMPDAPELPADAGSSPISLAIVGLNPNSSAAPPLPEGARDAQFAAGPELRPDGGTGGSANGATLTVPGLLVRNASPDAGPTLAARAAAPTSTGNLRAALHSSLPEPAATTEVHPAATRVAVAPDPMLEGRAVYAMTVQMPNVTSYSGSWLIWFAEREPHFGPSIGMSAPIPLRKVDPKYYQSAMADRVEGRVRLAAVIRKDGHVDSVRLLKHLDDRLDQSAQEAIDKWEFQPALRSGQPVEVDAVIEIPFRLAPKVAR